MSGERRLDVDGATLWTTAAGRGEPVVLLHGGPGLWDYLGPVAGLLDGVTTLRYGQRGCGRSTGGGPYTVAQAVADLDAVRVAYGLDRWSVLGHSWGAELALRYAAARPERCSRVIHVAGVGHPSGWRDGLRTAVAERLGADLARWQHLCDIPDRSEEQEHEFCLLQWSADYTPGTDVRRHAEALWATRPPGCHVNLEANQQLSGDPHKSDLVEVARRVACPVTMIHGADDPRPWRSTDTVHDALPHVHRIVIDHAGHLPWAEQPRRTQQAILAALAE